MHLKIWRIFSKKLSLNLELFGSVLIWKDRAYRHSDPEELESNG